MFLRRTIGKSSAELLDLCGHMNGFIGQSLTLLDGINSNLNSEIDLEKVTEETAIDLDIDFEKLFFNMLKAEADYLYTLEAWEGVLSEERRIEIVKEYKKSKTVHVEKKPGRNDPCPCGSGKKYKKCCGKVS